MSGKIQNEDVKSVAELVGAGGTASQLINDDKIWVKALSIDKTLNQAIADNDIGGGGTPPRSEVWLQGGNGFGSVNTKIFRFTTTNLLLGGNITYADSATLGASFTANITGVFGITFITSYSGGTTKVGLSRNASGGDLSTDISLIADANKLGYANSIGASAPGLVSIVLNLTAGDVIRAHGGLEDEGGTALTQFRMVQVSNQNASNFISATGGTITTDGNYKVHTFNSSGTFQIFSGVGDISYLAIGGGGAGGFTNGGGGGAGGYQSGIDFGMTVGSFPVVIGAGAAGITNDTSQSANGNNTTYNSHTALAGGGGGISNSQDNGWDGGSGGGAGSDGGAFLGGAGTAGQGNKGGNSVAGLNASCGGGGGAGSAGQDAPSNSVAGNGGSGLSSSITGSPVTRAGGGGGAIYNTGTSAGLGGSGGGGNGGFSSNGLNATANTGSGGGGEGNGGTVSGSGGSGVVIVRYQFQ